MSPIILANEILVVMKQLTLILVISALLGLILEMVGGFSQQR